MESQFLSLTSFQEFKASMDKKLQAEWANNLLNDDFFKKVIDDLKNQQISVIINTNRDEVDERESAYNHIKTLDLFLGHLQGIAAETKIQEKKWKIL